MVKEKNEEGLGKNYRFIATIVGVITLITVTFTALGVYFQERTQIQYNKEMIQQNSQHIAIVKSEFKKQTEKQTDTLREILIKVTRLETRAQITLKKSS